jgi:quinol-cytochrome oxidoreductase complex cytochrome b subunit
MDPLEKKVHELYQKQQREDEKSIPGFSIFRDKLKQKKTIKKHSWFLLKVAASVAIVVGAVSYYFFYSRKPPNEAANYPLNINQPLPTQPLLDKSINAEYIWNWKAPTDQLLQDATKSLITDL